MIAALRHRRTAAGLAGVLLVLLASGCSVLPERPATPASHALEAPETTSLGRIAARSLPAGYASGFQLLPVASAAYETRLALATQAERTLDVQTFVLAADAAGEYLLDSLRAAGARGVRVRLLVDDLNSTGTDELLAAFSTEPNVEVRLFNPFPIGRSSSINRLLLSLNELGRINHRMHNKLYVADNALAVFGGRNLGNEYFMRSEKGNFVDFDVLAAGRAVQELSASFDDYWNSALAYPIGSIVRPGGPKPRDFRDFAAKAALPPLDETIPPRFDPYVNAPSQLSAGRLELTGAVAHVFVDPVEKALRSMLKRTVGREGTVREFAVAAMRGAEHEVFVISPYFIPGELGIEAMRELRRRGVRLVLLTNSLAATDEPSVHGGYLRYRTEMLELGVEIYELSPSLARRSAQLGRFGSSSGMLHAKLFVVDGKRTFIGSMNMDGRSALYNTELGVILDSEAIATTMKELIRYQSSSWRVRLDPQTGRTIWIADEGRPDERVWHDEPEASWWLRLKASLLSDLVPEGWL